MAVKPLTDLQKVEVLTEALKAVQVELITLAPYLTGRYQSNVQGAVEHIRNTLEETE